MSDSHQFSRREFISSAAAVAAASAVLPISCAAQNKPAKAAAKASVTSGTTVATGKGDFRFAQIGCAGKGSSDLNEMLGAGGRLIALCDVDASKAADTYKKYPEVPKYTDFRKMLDKHEKEIDGVIVSTPDHVHAVASLDAMRRGKHVYVQKPMARTFEECQLMLDAAKKHNVVTQMGNQGHAGAGLLLWQEMMKADAFGEIERVETWSNRPIWPQGMTAAPKEDPVPATLDWDCWLGPQSMRPYSKEYLPFKWRGWWDFGCGAMGDMACHNMDPAFWILKLGLPTTIKAQASAPAGVAFPAWSIIEYTFAATSVYPKPIKLTWLDGKKLPERPKNTHAELKLGDNGCMIVGSKMSAKGGSHAAAPFVIALGSNEFGKATKDEEGKWSDKLKTLKGVNHYAQWMDAARAKDRKICGSKFEYTAPMTQSILLGCAALRFPGQELKWDNEKRQFSNCPEANAWLSSKPRQGYDMSI